MRWVTQLPPFEQIPDHRIVMPSFASGQEEKVESKESEKARSPPIFWFVLLGSTETRPQRYIWAKSLSAGFRDDLVKQVVFEGIL